MASAAGFPSGRRCPGFGEILLDLGLDWWHLLARMVWTQRFPFSWFQSWKLKDDSRVWEEVVHLCEVSSRQRRWGIVLVHRVNLVTIMMTEQDPWKHNDKHSSIESLTSRLSLSSSPLPLRFTLLFFLLACFTILGVFTSPFTSFGKIP